MLPAKSSTEMPMPSSARHLREVNLIAVQVRKHSGTHHWIKLQFLLGGTHFSECWVKYKGSSSLQSFTTDLPLKSGWVFLQDLMLRQKGRSGHCGFSIHESLKGHVYLVISDRNVRAGLVLLSQAPTFPCPRPPPPPDSNQSHRAPLLGIQGSASAAVTVCSDCHTVQDRLEKVTFDWHIWRGSRH